VNIVSSKFCLDWQFINTRQLCRAFRPPHSIRTQGPDRSAQVLSSPTRLVTNHIEQVQASQKPQAVRTRA